MKMKLKRKGKKAEFYTVKNRGTTLGFSEGYVRIYQVGEAPIDVIFNIDHDTITVPFRR